MIILKIIGVLLLIILILLIAAICIPVYVEIKYDETVTLRIKYLFVRFIKVFGGEEISNVEKELKEPTAFDKILSTITGFIEKSWCAIRIFFSNAANFIKRTLRKIRGLVRAKLKQKAKSRPKNKKQGTGGKKTSKTKSSDQSLFDSLREERGFWGAINFFVDLGKALSGGLVKMYSGIAANKFVLRVEIVGEDAADTAVKYGKICSVAFPALSFLLSNMRRYNRNIEITPNFDGDEGRIYFDGEFIIYPVLIIGHALSAVIKFAIKQIKITFKNQKMKG